MELILTRIAKRKAYTIGRLSLSPSPSPKREGSQEPTIASESPLLLEGQGGGSYFCDTLEPTWRDYEHGAYKVKGRSGYPFSLVAPSSTASGKASASMPATPPRTPKVASL